MTKRIQIHSIQIQFPPEYLVRCLEVLRAMPLKSLESDADRMTLLLLISKLEIAVQRFE